MRQKFLLLFSLMHAFAVEALDDSVATIELELSEDFDDPEDSIEYYE